MSETPFELWLAFSVITLVVTVLSFVLYNKTKTVGSYGKLFLLFGVSSLFFVIYGIAHINRDPTTLLIKEVAETLAFLFTAGFALLYVKVVD